MIDVVCGVIENENGKYLACLRPHGKHLGGLWEFPGGKIDAGENPESALIRELLEELGISVTVETALDPVVYEYDQGKIRLLPFRCAIIGGEMKALEHDELRWCSLEELAELNWAKADLPILDQLSDASSDDSRSADSHESR
ncbi:MAG: (deoxy)nucleoside triphosphate pyrophosphohydrolase [Gloeobacteraceae cyanobacterium ES-bin-144]|nr:(deoxy)nucleoside triphosphate pyrophosphohydrolase [Verrucomicrobiales bacterium]